MQATQRFDGAIAGAGSASGTRLVFGMWPRSPFGSITDVMVERADGHRVLLAPSATVAGFIAATYDFDEVRVEPTSLVVEGSSWTISTASLSARFNVGARTSVGHLLAAVPRPVVRTRTWCRLIDPPARLIRPGVRTHGTAGGGRHEWYCALDEHSITALSAQLDGVDLGPLRLVAPPVRFGFASTPPRPALVRLTTMIDGVGSA